MTGIVKNNVIEVRQGDSFAINFALKCKCGCKPFDLTGATMLMQVREMGSDNLIFAVNGTAVDVANGKMALLLTPTETSAAVGEYNCDVQITTADGSVNTIWPANVNQIGTFRITAQVTQ